MNKKLIKKSPLVLVEGGIYEEKIGLKDIRISVEVIENGAPRILNVPFYSFIALLPCKCSAYVRMSAQELFGKNYSFSNAWDRRYNDRLVAEVDGKFLEEFVDEGELQPGMAVGMYNPLSIYKNRIDQRGELVRYTHLALFLGLGRTHKPIFAEQFELRTIIRDERALREAGLQPIEIIDSRS